MSTCIGCARDIDTFKQESYFFPMGPLCVECGDKYGTKRTTQSHSAGTIGIVSHIMNGVAGLSQKDGMNCDKPSLRYADQFPCCMGQFKHNPLDPCPGLYNISSESSNEGFEGNTVQGSYIEQIVEAWKDAWKEYSHAVDAIPDMGIVASHDRHWSPYPEGSVNWMGIPQGCLNCGAAVKGNALTCEACDAEATKKLYGPTVCECGAEKANEGRPTSAHSNWCAKSDKK